MNAVPRTPLHWLGRTLPEGTDLERNGAADGPSRVGELRGDDPQAARRRVNGFLGALARSQAVTALPAALAEEATPSAPETIDIAQLLCSRLCHDLVSPAGAFGAAVDLLKDAGGNDTEALALVAASARQAIHRLAFFRAAFGRRGSAGGTLTLTDAKTLIAGLFEGGRVELDWPEDIGGGVDPNREWPTDAVRLVLCLALIAGEALQRGGRLRVRLAESATGVRVLLTATGKDARVGPDTIEAMSTKTSIAGLTTRNVHAHYLARLAERLGTTVRVDHSQRDEVRLAMTWPAPPREPARAMPEPRPTSVACGAL